MKGSQLVTMGEGLWSAEWRMQGHREWGLGRGKGGGAVACCRLRGAYQRSPELIGACSVRTWGAGDSEVTAAL